MMSLGGNHGGLGFGTLPSASTAGTLPGISTLGLPNFSNTDISMLLQNPSHLQALAKVQQLQMQQSAFQLQRFASPLRTPVPTATVTKDSEHNDSALLDNSHTTSPSNSSSSFSPPANKRIKQEVDSSSRSPLETNASALAKVDTLYAARSSPVFPGVTSDTSLETTPPSSHNVSASQSMVTNGNGLLAVNQMQAVLAAQQQLLSQPDTVSMAMMGPYQKALGPGLSPEPNQTTSIARALALSQSSSRRPRSEKKPIPDDLKDEKYFERRKRNNNAAKKSRDARKAREDEIAIRASYLEKENAILRAQVSTLREEANSLRHLLLQKRSRQG